VATLITFLFELFIGRVSFNRQRSIALCLLFIQLEKCLLGLYPMFLHGAVPPYYALILRSLTVLEGLALSSDPQFKVLAAAYPYMAKRLLTDRDPYLRDALIELLFKDGRFRWA
jgi:predicted unusual protein kinase regulating ubiquinone biosynthesis (AarF/ABC1/UbiB family)